MRPFFHTLISWYHTLRASPRVGFTLLETVVAVTLLFVATMGPLTLMTKSLSDFYASQNKLVALHLAQEGIELVRVVREHNAICDFLTPGWLWDTDSDGIGNLQGVNRKADPLQWTDTFSCGGVTYNNPNFSAGCSGIGNRIRMDGNGHFTYIITGTTPTIFNRCLTIANPGAAEDDIIPPADMLDVVSQVTWAEKRGPTRTITLQTRLYRWK